MDNRLLRAINDVFTERDLAAVAHGGITAAKAGPELKKLMFDEAAKGAASTGRMISDLSGAAAMKATLAKLGGGAKSMGGGGQARGEAILSRSSLAIQLTVFGITAAPTIVKITRRYSELVREDRIAVREAEAAVVAAAEDQA